MQSSRTPIVLVPGIQGRWEWMAPAIHALQRHHDVLTFSLGECAGPRLFERWAARIDALLDGAGYASAAVVGVSFGGLVAAWYAGSRPDRVSRLVLVSSPSPSWRLDEQSMRYVRYPRLSLPLFALRGLRRLAPEVATAVPRLTTRMQFGASYAFRAVRFPASPRLMAGWVDAWAQTDLRPTIRRISAPTLVITGEDNLDRVVPVASSREYLDLIHGARHARLPGTGHIGFISKPHEFAALVTDFVHAR
jgi:pimeloyl-ACP methyl ester carboxylesterase